MSEKSIGKTVRFTSDKLNSPTLTVEQKERLESMRDEDIDLGDIPSQAGKGDWTRPGLLGGSVGVLRREAMKERLLLLDEKVVEFFNASGEQAPAAMNAVLLNYVETHKKTA